MREKIISKYREYGLLRFLFKIIYWSYKYVVIGIRKYGAYIVWPVMKAFFGNRTFLANGQKLRLFFHPYNITWNNERMIEVPIALNWIRDDEEFLEIGNVLNHYIKKEHTVIDLYEKGKGVINQDVVTIIGFENKFDKIISISTLEHVGWDTAEKKDPGKLKIGLESIMRCLKTGGSLVFTVPVGYNEFLDQSLKDGYFKDCVFIKRTGYLSWRETSFEEAIKCKYGLPFNAANALAVITINKI